MKIAFIVNSFPKLSETFILNQITGLLDRGQEVDIYARSPSTESKVHPDVDNYHLLARTHFLSSKQNKHSRFIRGIDLLHQHLRKNPRVVINSFKTLKLCRSAAPLKLLSQAGSFIGRGPYDIIHCQYGPNGNLALSIKETGALKGKIITSFHGYDISTYVKRMGRHTYDHLFRAGDLFLCISKYMKDELLSLGCSEDKIMLHRVGVDMDKFNFSAVRSKGHEKIQILTIARLVEKKGISYAIQSIANIAKNLPQINYTIIGDGPLREDINVMIKGLNVEDNVDLLGWMREEEIIEWLYKADILLAPSVTSQNGDKEGIPVAIIEALARGLPVLSTWHSGIPELIEDGKSGVLVPERDVAALTDKIEYLIMHPEMREAMGRNGRSYVEEYHNIRKLNDRLINIYRDLIADNHCS